MTKRCERTAATNVAPGQQADDALLVLVDIERRAGVPEAQPRRRRKGAGRITVTASDVLPF